MDAPVPASALIHSATLVSAGVYLILRFFDILQVSGFLPLISVLGALTAAYGGIVAGLQTDLKRALAYSTISHCGFLFTFTALGGSSASLLYLFLHGFFKALSFICAGEFIRVSAGYQDLNRMGGGFFQTPSLSAQFLVAMGNLCGLPFFIGYFFKSNFQNYVLNSGYVNFLLVVLLLVGLLCSLLYFFKVFYCVVFSFKKTNFKLLQESLKQNKNYFKYPLKNPRALVAIFWFLMIATLVCIFLYFPFKNNIITCNITDTQVSSMGLLSVPTNNSVVKHNQVNYLFAFYTFFLCIAVTLIISYSCRRIGWCSFINNLFLVIASLILGYAYLLIS
jgi:NADH:ubiquinone oxidoreductase subunit 5 (subunit L)/multisubunit Na+/H+ antiporter MnhA subunit